MDGKGSEPLRLESEQWRMAPQVENDGGRRVKGLSLQWVGGSLLVLGGAMIGVYLARISGGMRTGFQYFEYVSTGTLFALAGYVFLVLGRRAGRA